MNKKLIEFNENFGLVINENGELKYITKDNENSNFEEILLTENEIEKLQIQLNNLKTELENLESKQKETVSVHFDILFIEGLICSVGILNNANLGLLAGLIATSFVGLEGINIGIKNFRNKNKQELLSKYKDLEDKKTTLENILARLKETSYYYEKSKQNDNNYSSTYEEIDIPITTISKPKIKTLNMTRTK